MTIPFLPGISSPTPTSPVNLYPAVPQNPELPTGNLPALPGNPTPVSDGTSSSPVLKVLSDLNAADARLASLHALHGDAGYDATNGFLGTQGQINNDGNNALNYINPKTDHRLNSILAFTHSPLVHGIIQQTDALVTGGGMSNGTKFNPQPYPYACRFMFNPPQVNVNYAINDQILPLNNLTPAQAASKSFFAGSTSISFDLLFDRTYEVAYGPFTPNSPDLRKIGVYADVAALEAVVGVRSKRAYSGAPPPSSDGKAVPNPTYGTGNNDSHQMIGNMTLVPVYIIFGGGGTADGKYAPITGLAFVAYITSMSVTYGLFSQNMIPTRAGVSISAVQLVGQNPISLNETLPYQVLNQSDRVTIDGGGNYAPGTNPPGTYSYPAFPGQGQGN